MLALVVTLLHLDKFHFVSPNWNSVAGTWVWSFVYLLGQFILSALWVMQARNKRTEPARSAPVPCWLPRALQVQGTMMLLTGVSQLLFPTALAAAWAYPSPCLLSAAIPRCF